MATYSSFKQIPADGLIANTIVSGNIAANTVTATNIAAGAVPSSAMSGVVTSANLATTIDLSGKTVTYRPIINADVSGSAGITGTTLASGAAVSNIGFTPVNRAGDTLTGQLQVPSGSASSPSIQYVSSSNSGINITSNNVAIVAGGATAVNIDSNGYITRPNHPMFSAVGQNGWYYAPQFGGTGEWEVGSIWNWTASHQYGGNNFAGAPGRFTAPVAGYYTFHTWWYLLNDANTPPNYMHFFFRKNNSRGWTAGGRSPYIICMHMNTNSYDDGYPHTAVIDMAAGDYCSLGCVYHGNSSRMHSGHHLFSGHLIG
jgi:hypothetical protein